MTDLVPLFNCTQHPQLRDLTADEIYLYIWLMREFVKIRKVGDSLVVTLPQTILKPLNLETGDRVLVEADPPHRIVLSKEGKAMPLTQRLELEVDLLEKKRAAIDSDLRYKELQYKDNMPSDPGMEDNGLAVHVMSNLVRQRDTLAAELAQKRLDLYDLGGQRPGD